MSIEVIQTIAEAQSLIPAWRRFTDLHPFQSPEWCLNWFEHFGGQGQLALICDRDDNGALNGLAPLFWEKRFGGWRLKFLGSGMVCSDYTSILTGSHNRRLVLSSLAAEIKRMLGRRSHFSSCGLQLEGIESGSEWFQEFARQMKGQRFTIDQYPLQSTYRLQLPQDWDTYTHLLGKSFRRKVKKLHARLQNGEVKFHRTDAKDVMDKMFATLVALHQKRRNTMGEPGSFADPRFGAFLKTAAFALAERGQAEIQWIEAAQDVIAIQLCLVYSNTISTYVTGMDPDYRDHQPGFTAVAASIGNAIERGMTDYDFLRGDEPYKRHWRAQACALTRAHVTPPRWLSRTTESAYHRAIHAKRLIRRTLKAIKPTPTP